MSILTTVSCDNGECTDEIFIEDEDYIEELIIDNEWINHNGSHYCKKCAEKHKKQREVSK